MHTVQCLPAIIGSRGHEGGPWQRASRGVSGVERGNYIDIKSQDVSESLECGERYLSRILHHP